jgi:predicted aspartyl protease
MNQFGRAWSVRMAIAAVAAMAAIRADAAPCRFVKFATMPVSFDGLSPTIEGSVNGHAMKVLVDSGAYATMLTRAIADRAGLALGHSNVTVYGVGGESQRYIARVDEVSFGPVRWTRANLAVVWSVAGRRSTEALLGADFLFRNDIEMALSDKEIRYFKAEGNCDGGFLAYWDRDASVVPMQAMAPDDLRQVIPIEVNGKTMRALIDSGAGRTYIDAAAAARAGVTPNAGSTRGQTHGVGERAVDAWIGSFERVTIGSETIQNTQLAVMDMWAALRRDANDTGTAEVIAEQPEVILGADFLRAHRVLFSVSQRRFYFTHLGGPVFAAP